MIIRPSRAGMTIDLPKLRHLISNFGNIVGVKTMHGYNARVGSPFHAYLQGAANALDFAISDRVEDKAFQHQLIEILLMMKENYTVVIELDGM